MVCYLLSDAGSFTTGTDMLITGKDTESKICGAADADESSSKGGMHAGRLPLMGDPNFEF